MIIDSKTLQRDLNVMHPHKIATRIVSDIVIRHLAGDNKLTEDTIENILLDVDHALQQVDVMQIIKKHYALQCGGLSFKRIKE